MNTPIFNRAFQHPADGWYQIEAKGDHPNDAAGVVQVIDGKSADAVASDFNAKAAAGTLRHGHEMLVDLEHFSSQPDKESRAYGWLQELQAREDGIYGRIHWTATGQKAVDGGDYRFFSTEYDTADCKVLNDGDPQRIRPLKLAGLTLTNMHNNRGQAPITNRDVARRQETANAVELAAAPQKAAWLFNQLVRLEQAQTRMPASMAWTTVMNRERTLYALAEGKYPAESIFAVQPGLERRLRIFNRFNTALLNDSAADAAANAVASDALDYLKTATDAISDPDADRLSSGSPKVIWTDFQIARRIDDEQKRD